MKETATPHDEIREEETGIKNKRARGWRNRRKETRRLEGIKKSVIRFLEPNAER